MQLINKFLHEYLYQGVLVYLNDILIYTKILDEHGKLVRAVFKKLQKAQLYAKLSKCNFHKTNLDYLGYRISKEGWRWTPEK